MTEFENELKRAFERREPPADFTARVLARCAREETRAAGSPWRIFSTWRLAAVAAAALLVAGGGAYEQHLRQVRGLAAKRQVMLAMRIAGSKLQEVQERVAKSGEAEQ